jgi:hypothetical protein
MAYNICAQIKDAFIFCFFTSSMYKPNFFNKHYEKIYYEL